MIFLQDVSKTYTEGISPALKSINVELREREFTFLVGPSGAGKTTFLRLLIREEQPTSGRIYIDGQEISRISQREVPMLRRKIGTVFQDYKLLPYKTVFENVALCLEIIGYPQKKVTERVNETLALVGLKKLGQRFPRQLSGGEQQRVSIARAIIHSPPVLVCDEPTGNLDPVTGWEIMQLLTKINAMGTTMIVATHNKEIVDTVRRRVIALEDGTIVRDARGGYEAEAPGARGTSKSAPYRPA